MERKYNAEMALGRGEELPEFSYVAKEISLRSGEGAGICAGRCKLVALCK